MAEWGLLLKGCLPGGLTIYGRNLEEVLIQGAASKLFCLPPFHFKNSAVLYLRGRNAEFTSCRVHPQLWKETNKHSGGSSLDYISSLRPAGVCETSMKKTATQWALEL